jgi:hypothetical protein
MDAVTSPRGANAAPVLPGAGRASFGQASVSAMSMKWSALHEAAGVVAALAGVAAQPMSAAERNFPATIRDAGGWRREHAEQGVDDLAAIMEPGLAALLAVHARGADPRPAARTLYEEFLAARAAVLALAPPAVEKVGRSLV